MLKIDCSFPKISCLMVTADGRFDYAAESYRCYINQTYPNKELLIVTDSGPEYKKQISEMISGRNDVHFFPLTGKYTLGALRNISIQLCRSDIFVQWDDDDFNMPDRLMIQYSALSKTDKKACYLADQLHYYFPTQQLFWENWWEHKSGYNIRYGLIPGTLMAYRKEFVIRYPSSGKYARSGEDSVLSDILCSQNQIHLLNNKGVMQVYSYHGKNVWDIEHHISISKHRSHDSKFMNQNRQKICRTLKFMNFSKTVKVMGRDGLAFIYEADDV